MSIILTGTLGHDAVAFTDPGGAAWLRLEIHQDPHRLAAVALRRYGDGPAAHIAAHAKARELRQNAIVTVHAKRWHLAEQRGHPHLVLADVSHIEHQPIVRRARHAPESELA